MLFTPHLSQQVVDVFPVLTGKEKQQVEVRLRSRAKESHYNVNWRESLLITKCCSIQLITTVASYISPGGPPVPFQSFGV